MLHFNSRGHNILKLVRPTLVTRTPRASSDQRLKCLESTARDTLYLEKQSNTSFADESIVRIPSF